MDINDIYRKCGKYFKGGGGKREGQGEGDSRQKEGKRLGVFPDL